jgi:hypothetical protein
VWIPRVARCDVKVWDVAHDGGGSARVNARPAVQGLVAPGLGAVRAEFARNFAERAEEGAGGEAYSVSHTLLIP